MPSVQTEFSCPTCKAEGKSHRINATDGALICTHNGTHLWRDTTEFLALKPVMEFKVAPPKFEDTTVRGEIKLMVPIAVKDALVQKWGDKINDTVVALLRMLTEGEVLGVPMSDLKLIGEKLGKIPESSGELKGLVYSAVMDRDTAIENEKESAGKILAIVGKNPGMVVINLGDQYENAVDQAKGRDTTVENFCETSIKNGLANSWF